MTMTDFITSLNREYYKSSSIRQSVKEQYDCIMTDFKNCELPRFDIVHRLYLQSNKLASSQVKMSKKDKSNQQFKGRIKKLDLEQVNEGDKNEKDAETEFYKFYDDANIKLKNENKLLNEEIKRLKESEASISKQLQNLNAQNSKRETQEQQNTEEIKQLKLTIQTQSQKIGELGIKSSSIMQESQATIVFE
jgi:hypothetical protein